MDRLLELANGRWSAPVLQALGLPQPRKLPRQIGAYMPQEHVGRLALVLGAPGGFAAGTSSDHLSAGGAELSSSGELHAVILDATGVQRADALVCLHDYLPSVVSRLRTGGRVVLLANGDASSPEAAASARAVEGFSRSLGKELGRRGGTSNCLYVNAESLPGLGAALDFFATDRSAYVSGQALRIGPVASTQGARPAPRVAIVTGAAGGIGAATVRRLAAEGCRLLCVDIPQAQEALAAIAAEVGGKALPLDIATEDAGRRLLEVIRPHGGVDVVVHNAGITRDRTLLRMSAAEWNSVLAVNLKAVLAIDLALDAAIDLALDAAVAWRAGACEVCLASISGIAGNAGQTNYAASKAALLGYVAARARFMQQMGGTVNAVAPGFIETAMTARIPLMVREAGRRLNSLSQGGRPEDVAEAIAFLARPRSHGISGQTLRVCGQSLLGA
jgi:3-oxoacyl-[acyl-carrier protein] reductase